MIIKNGNVFQENNIFKKQDLSISGELICQNNSNDNGIIDASDCYVIPGLTDIHIHGCKGHDFCDGSQEALKVMSKYLSENGITSFTPTSMTLPEEKLQSIFENAASFQNKYGSIYLGINMEGPFFSAAKKGAQNAKYIHKPDAQFFKRLNNASDNKIKLVALAPEIEGADKFIKEVKDSAVISIGHTEADYETASKALDEGASHITHLFNAMKPFTHREPGVVGAAFDSKSCTVELICDGIHINPCVIRAAFQLFSDNRIVLISDSMMATGMPDGKYNLGGQTVTVYNKRAELNDGTIAGSSTNLMDCMRKAVSFGIPLESAVKAATVNPLKVINEFKMFGSLTPGKFANMVILNKNLEIKKVIIKGKEIKSEN